MTGCQDAIQSPDKGHSMTYLKTRIHWSDRAKETATAKGLFFTNLRPIETLLSDAFLSNIFCLKKRCKMCPSELITLSVPHQRGKKHQTFLSGNRPVNLCKFALCVKRVCGSIFT